MKKTITFFIIGMFCCILCKAQATDYASQRLMYIGELFPSKNFPLKDSVFIFPQLIQEKSLAINYNEENKISHLGISLFSNETKEMINQPVCNFIERLMLELLLQKTIGKQQEKLKEYNIQIYKTGLQINTEKKSINRFIQDIDNPTTFSLQTDGTRFKAIWEYGMNEVFTLDFPASRELIFGTDKKESDDEMEFFLVNQSCSKQSKIEDFNYSYDDLERVGGTDIFLQKDDVFMINEINSDIYLQKNDTRLQPLYDAAYPNESLANLFLTDKTSDPNLKLKITHRKYGNFTPEFEIPLHEFTCLFKQDFNMYCGIQKGNTEKIKLTVILQSKSYNFIHMLVINTTREQIFSKNGIINANFFTNIPQHNIKSLFNN